MMLRSVASTSIIIFLKSSKPFWLMMVAAINNLNEFKIQVKTQRFIDSSFFVVPLLLALQAAATVS